VLYNLFKAALINGLALSAILFALDDDSPFSREHLYATYGLLFVLILLWRYSAIKLIYLYRKSGFNYNRVIIIGGAEVAKQLYTYFISDDVLGVRVKGVFTDSNLSFDIKENIKSAGLDEFQAFAIDNEIDEIYYTLPLTYTQKITDLVNFCDKNMIRFKVVPDFRGFLFKRVNIDFFDDVHVVTLR
jgi:FlaA1/EpsC-like NDP-sugar epimerase